MRQPKGIRIMYATVTQPKIDHSRYETGPSAHSDQAVPKEQHDISRLEELAETLDLPLDVQI
jgi:hypothetical protein